MKEDNVPIPKKTLCSSQRRQCVLANEDNVFLPEKTMYSFIEKNVFCPVKTMCFGRIQYVLSKEDNVPFPKRTICRVHRAQTEIFSPSFGHTELIIGPSRAKHCEEVDDEVHFWLESLKPAQKGQR